MVESCICSLQDGMSYVINFSNIIFLRHQHRYHGEDISPSAAAAYVQQNSDTLSYIPGSVRLYDPLPVSFPASHVP